LNWSNKIRYDVRNTEIAAKKSGILHINFSLSREAGETRANAARHTEMNVRNPSNVIPLTPVEIVINPLGEGLADAIYCGDV